VERKAPPLSQRGDLRIHAVENVAGPETARPFHSSSAKCNFALRITNRQRHGDCIDLSSVAGEISIDFGSRIDDTQFNVKGDTMNQQDIDWKEGEKLIGYIVKRIAVRLPSHIDAEDLQSVGVIGLIDAAKKFDPARGNKFSTYAAFRIKGAILDQLRSMDWVSRSARRKTRKLERAYAEVDQKLGRRASGEEVANFLDMAADEFYALQNKAAAGSMLSLDKVGHSDDETAGTLVDIVENHKSVNPFAAVSQAQSAGRIAEAVKSLPKQERLTVSLYYYEDLNMKEIGGILGVSESRVCQIHTKATENLRAELTS
jgi:RNA polymerase sigma factor for flagellar operon FliA